MDSKEITISFVGAGAGGITGFCQLVEKLLSKTSQGKKIRIFLFDKSGTFGPGLAYSTPCTAHIINMRAGTMSAFPERPTHFVDWMKSNASTLTTEFPDLLIHDNAYPPRKVYGKYLTDMFGNTLELAKGTSLEVECINEEVCDIKDENERQNLILKNGKRLQTDFTILAPGNFPPTMLFELRGTEGYFPYPWPVETLLNGISPNQPVCIIGSGLSAVDTLFSLLENGHREKIYFISRRGFLPKVQCEPMPHRLRYLTMDTIDDVISSMGEKSVRLEHIVDLFMKEIEAAEGRKINWLKVINPKEPIEVLFEESIAQAKKGPRAGQAALTATGDIIGRIWNLLSYEEQRKFDCFYKTLWTVYRHPMPLINAEKVMQSITSGRLEVLSGITCSQYLGRGKGFVVTMQTRFGIDYGLKAPCLINATGQGLDVTKYDSDVLQNLLSREMILPHPSGGIQVDFATSAVINKDGRQSSRMFAVGEITRGVHFLTNAISHNSSTAGRIMDCIMNSLST